MDETQKPTNEANERHATAQSKSEAPNTANEAGIIPGVDKVTDFLLYGLSLPERAIRSSSAALSGTVKHSASLLIPQAFRSSKTYSTFVEQMLDFMAHDVGGVERDAQTPTDQVENYVAKKTVGGFIELAALPLLHVSPMTVLAIISDVAYGSQTYLKELSTELKEQGVIDKESTIDHAADLLDALKKTTSTAADAFDKPPLSIEGLSDTIRQVTEASKDSDLTRAIPQQEVERIWNEMHQIATLEDQNVLEVSSAMTMYAMNRIGKVGQGALSTISVAGNMFDQHILDHYRTSITELHQKGYYTFLAETSKPYISAMWQNFSSQKETITEDFFSGRLIGRTWQSFWNWFQKEPDQDSLSENPLKTPE